MNRFLFIGIITAMGTAQLPTMASAQSPSPALEQAPPNHPTVAVPASPTPQQYLGTTKQLLDAVSATSLDRDGEKQLSRLREDFAQLVTSYQTRVVTPAGSAGSIAATTVDPSKPVVDWTLKFYDVERDLASILGEGAPSRGISPTMPSGTAPPILERVAVPDIGAKNLNADIRAQLEQIRTHVELFYDATTATVPAVTP